MGKDIDDFINNLAGDKSPNEWSLNIYQGEKGRIRRENLSFYLKEMKDLNPSRLFVGEAPGRWGCFQTGIPFTDINTLAENVFFEERRKKLGNGKKLEKEELIRLHIASSKAEILKKEIAERSSNVVWECLDKLSKFRKEEKLPLLWNIYPFHPSDVNDEHTSPEDRPNRKPNALERTLGVDFLFDLLSLFEIKEIYAVGVVPYNTLNLKETSKELKNRGIELVKYIRHPAYGGKNDFIKGFNEIYRIEYEEPNNQKNRRIGRIRKIRIIGRIRRIGKIKTRKTQKNKNPL